MVTPEFHKNWLTEKGLALVYKYPLIFLERDEWIISHIGEEEFARRQKEGTYVALRFGFEFGEGWFGLVDDFCAKATELVQKDRRDGFVDSQIHGLIFKEKWGTLVWQGNSKLSDKYKTEFGELLNTMEDKSFTVCEICGNHGEINKGPWHKVRCENCK